MRITAECSCGAKFDASTSWRGGSSDVLLTWRFEAWQIEHLGHGDQEPES